jgi:hypothetical protein
MRNVYDLDQAKAEADRMHELFGKHYDVVERAPGLYRVIRRRSPTKFRVVYDTVPSRKMMTVDELSWDTKRLKKKYGVSSTRIAAWRRELGGKNRKYEKVDKVKLVEALKVMSPYAYAHMIGMQPNNLYRFMRKNGIVAPTLQPHDAEYLPPRDQLRYAVETYGMKLACMFFKQPLPVIQRWCKALSIEGKLRG